MQFYIVSVFSLYFFKITGKRDFIVYDSKDKIQFLSKKNGGI